MNLFFDSIIVLYLVAAITFAVAIFKDRKVPGKWEHKHPRTTLTVFMLLCASVLTMVWGSFVEPRLITVKNVSIDLPAFEPVKPVRAALISDIHAGTYKKDGWIRRVFARIAAEKPDLVLMAGDMIVDKTNQAKYLSAFSILHSTFPIYAVLGDHDYQLKRKKDQAVINEEAARTVADTLAAAGVRVLSNETEKINLGCTGLSPGSERTKLCSFWLIGLDDWLAGKTDPAQALTHLPTYSLTHLPKIILVHNPDFILDPQSKNADLILAGNTHGGQIRLPFIGPVARLPSNLPRRFDEGLFTLENGARLFITSGISESGPRTRLFNPPEIVLLELY